MKGANNNKHIDWTYRAPPPSSNGLYSDDVLLNIIVMEKDWYLKHRKSHGSSCGFTNIEKLSEKQKKLLTNMGYAYYHRPVFGKNYAVSYSKDVITRLIMFDNQIMNL